VPKTDIFMLTPLVAAMLKKRYGKSVSKK